ncbi:GNAT family N-acetyltransferase [Hyphomonas sp.]|uniref:GNAT family N-acetyltransferase n=1 Tax=Hyphomonas sp. TaxID=87 RepID=UPI0025B9D727|nr:GNAT family N-acetyltransferase [Hyphomonas sp.]
MLAGPVEISPDDERLLSAIGQLRVRAWRARQPAFPDMREWLDDFDLFARHWTLSDNGILVAAARMTVHAELSSVPNAEIFASVFPNGLPGPIASLNRLVVDPAFAGRGLSRALDEARIEAAGKMQCANIIVETFARTSRAAALELLGFEIAGLSLPYVSGPLFGIKNGSGGGVVHRRRLRTESVWDFEPNLLQGEASVCT